MFKFNELTQMKNEWEHITPYNVLVSLARAVHDVKEFEKSMERKSPKSTDVEVPLKKIIFEGYVSETLKGISYDDIDAQMEVKRVLWQLQRTGYVSTRIIRRHYNVRVWSLTKKGVNFLIKKS